MAALAELLETEAAYVHDLTVLCDVKRALVTRKLCNAPDVGIIFANCDTLRGINSELLAALEGDDAPATDPLERVATAFQTIAPYLKAYAIFCANAITSQERLKTLRQSSSALEQTLAELEAAMGQPVGSWLIKPVQRLCKYPLLLHAVLKEVPESSAVHVGLRQASEAIEGIVNDVNERVRAAEEREGLLVLAEALGRRELITPQRALLLSVSAHRWIETHSSSVSSIESEVHRLLRLDNDRPTVRPQHRAAVWLCSDMLLMGRPRGSSYAVIEMSAAHLTSSEHVAGFGDDIVRLTCENGTAYLLQLATPAVAHSLMHALAGAREKTAEMQRARARGALGEIEARKIGERAVAETTANRSAALQQLKERRATRTAADSLPLGGDPRDALFHSTASKRDAPIGPHGSWTVRLRLRMSAAARELSAGSFGRRKRSNTEAPAEDGEQPTGLAQTHAPDAKSQRVSDHDDEQLSCGGTEDGIARLLRYASSIAKPPPAPPPSNSMLTVQQERSQPRGDSHRRTAPTTPSGRLSRMHEGLPNKSSLERADEGSPAAPPCLPPPMSHVLRDLIRTAEGSGDAFHEELLLALQRRAALSS